MSKSKVHHIVCVNLEEQITDDAHGHLGTVLEMFRYQGTIRKNVEGHPRHIEYEVDSEMAAADYCARWSSFGIVATYRKERW